MFVLDGGLFEVKWSLVVVSYGCMSHERALKVYHKIGALMMKTKWTNYIAGASRVSSDSMPKGPSH